MTPPREGGLEERQPWVWVLGAGHIEQALAWRVARASALLVVKGKLCPGDRGIKDNYSQSYVTAPGARGPHLTSPGTTHKGR